MTRAIVYSLREYLAAVAGVAVLTLGCWFLTPLTGYAAISLIYLLGVLLAGMLLSRGPVFLVITEQIWRLVFVL